MRIESIAPIMRSDHRVVSDPGIEIAVREVTSGASVATRSTILLVHGGGGGGVASFDVQVPGYSLAADLAEVGFRVFTIDLRGWGGSTRPHALDLPPNASPPAVTSAEAVRDISAVAHWIRNRTAADSIGLLGWATGGHWAAMYASQEPSAVHSLVTLNSLYAVDAPWSMQAAFADPDDPKLFHRAIGAYALRSEESLLGAWNRSIPIEDKDAWRDPRVAAAYAETTIASDPTSATRTPPSVRAPTGFQSDSFAQSQGTSFWDASAITARTLIVRGSLDFWSRPEDLTVLRDDLVNAREVETLEIEQGTHFLFLDRPDRGRSQFLEPAIRFLSGG